LIGSSGSNQPVVAVQAASSGSAAATAILAEAKKHDNEAYVYGGGHPPGRYRDGSGLDCSGLVDIAMLRATGINEDDTAGSFRNSRYWASVPISEVHTGDIVYLLRANHPGHTDDHVAIVVSNDSSHLTVFEAYGSRGVRFNDQIRQSSGYTYSNWDGALRFHR